MLNISIKLSSVSIILLPLKRVKLYMSGTIISRVGSFVHVIYSLVALVDWLLFIRVFYHLLPSCPYYPRTEFKRFEYFIYLLCNMYEFDLIRFDLNLIFSSRHAIPNRYTNQSHSRRESRNSKRKSPNWEQQNNRNMQVQVKSRIECRMYVYWYINNLCLKSHFYQTNNISL